LYMIWKYILSKTFFSGNHLLRVDFDVSVFIKEFLNCSFRVLVISYHQFFFRCFCYTCFLSFLDII
jgi:hypothetical protein